MGSIYLSTPVCQCHCDVCRDLDTARSWSQNLCEHTSTQLARRGKLCLNKVYLNVLKTINKLWPLQRLLTIRLYISMLSVNHQSYIHDVIMPLCYYVYCARPTCFTNDLSFFNMLVAFIWSFVVLINENCRCKQLILWFSSSYFRNNGTVRYSVRAALLTLGIVLCKLWVTYLHVSLIHSCTAH